MRKHKQPTLGDIYGEMLKNVQVIKEDNAQENINKSKKIPKQPKNAFNQSNTLTDGGPKEKSGYHKALNDDCDCQEDEEDVKYDRKKYRKVDQLKAKLKKPGISDKEKKGLEKAIRNIENGFEATESEERLYKESKKIARERLNTFMTKKSTFDKLFESVMGGNFDQQEDAQEIDALGLGDAPTDDEFGDDEFGGEEDQVTITLDRATAQQFLDLLQAAVGEGGEEDFDGGDLDFNDEGDDFGGDDEEEEDNGEEEGDYFSHEEDEERGVHPTDKVGNDGTVGPKNSKDGPHKLQNKSNKVNGKPQPKGQKTKVVGTTDKVGNDGDYGHALHGAKQPDMGKQNKVSDLRQAEDYFR